MKIPRIKKLKVTAFGLVVTLVLGYIVAASAAGGPPNSFFESGGAGNIQQGVSRDEPAPQSLPAQSGDGRFKPYTPPPKSDGARRPALPGSDQVELTGPRKMSKAEEEKLRALAPSNIVGTLTIIIVPGEGLAANPAAL